MIDINLIRKKLGELENNIITLEHLKSYSLTDILNNREKAWSVEHGLQLSIQIIIDEPVKSKNCHIPVIPAQAGIQENQALLDSRFRGNDKIGFRKTFARASLW